MTRKVSRAKQRLIDALDDDLLAEYSAYWNADPDWPAARERVFLRDRYTCVRCGGPGTDGHHRYALQMGGRLGDPHRHDPPRVVTLCRRCHQWVHEHPSAAELAGLRVHTADDPARVPVQTWTGLVTLGENADMTTLRPRYR